jgi:hypothetical protein
MCRRRSIAEARDPAHNGRVLSISASLPALRRCADALNGRIERGELTAADMILGCRRILDLWVEAGGASTDDPVIGFLAVESQTDHVLGGRSVQRGRDGDRLRFAPASPQEAEEVEACGRCFLGGFTRDVRSLRDWLAER